MKIIKNSLLMIFVVLVFVFTIQNRQTLSGPLSFQLDLYLTRLSTGDLPLYSLLLISFFAGLLMTGIMGLVQRFKLRAQYRETKHLLEKKEKELNSLRNLPVLESPDQGNEAPTAPLDTSAS